MLTTHQVQDEIFYSSAVIEHIVPKGKQPAFRQWHQTLVHSIQKAEGYVWLDLHSPLERKNDVLKWYSVIHFDTPDHLNDWLTSRDRQETMKAGQQFFETYRFKSFTTGVEGWFSHQAGAEVSSLGLSAWKEALIVVLGLYPPVNWRNFDESDSPTSNQEIYSESLPLLFSSITTAYPPSKSLLVL